MTDVNSLPEEAQESSWKGPKLVGLAVLTLLFGITVIYILASVIGE